MWLEDLSVLVDWFFLKYLFSPRKINFAKKDKTKSRIEKTPTEKAKNNPSLKALGVVKALGSSSRALRFGNRAQTATPHRSLERPHGKPREETFASFRSAPRSLVPSSHPLERTARRTSRSKKKNETTLRCIIELQRSLKNKKKGGGQNRCVEIVPAAMRCDATYLDLGGLEAGDGRDLLSSSKHDV